MKIKPNTRAKYAWYLSMCRKDEPRPLEKIPFTAEGSTALLAFHVLESTGRFIATKEPELLEKYMQGKKWHGVTIENCAEDFFLNRLLFSKEIKENYPEWVANEIFTAAEKLARQKIGFAPTFVKDRMDFSERKSEWAAA